MSTAEKINQDGAALLPNLFDLCEAVRWCLVRLQ